MDVITIRVTPVNPVTIPVQVTQGNTAGNYQTLTNKPLINGIALVGDTSSFALGVASESEAALLRSWVAYLSQLVGRIPLYNDQGVFTNTWAAALGIDDGSGVYNLSIDTNDVIPAPIPPAILTEPTE